nr:dipeptidase PepV [uncultured Aminipila sp.]
MEYLKLIEEYKDEMIKTVQELVAIKSIEDKPVTDAPFGKGVAEAFQYMLKKAESEGFDTENVDNYGGHIEFGGYLLDDEGKITGTSEEVMGIIGHLDVVPEGTGWEYEPYSGVIADGKIFGRGTIDNKGPVVAAFFAMKALKDSGYIPEKKVRLILGLDEETNWKGMKHYLSKVKAPDFGFTPDAEYPAIHGEKGIMVFQLAKKIGKTTGKGIELRSLKGGNAANMVADYARAVIRADKMEAYDKVKELAANYRNVKCAEEGQIAFGAKLNCKGVGKSLEIVAQGVSAHGATPECGVNAITVLMDFLNEIDIINDDVNEFVEFYNQHIGFELDGTAMGCGLSDEPSGKLIFNVGKIELEGEAVMLTINIRFPVTYSEDVVYEAMMPVINKYNMGVIKIKAQDPIYMPKDDPMIKTLMDIYGEHTGDRESEPIVIGGGTYARATKNIVAFGSVFPGEPDLAHQKNEYIDIDNLLLNAKIFADAIYRLTH